MSGLLRYPGAGPAYPSPEASMPYAAISPVVKSILGWAVKVLAET